MLSAGHKRTQGQTANLTSAGLFFAQDFVFFHGWTCTFPRDSAEPDGRPGGDNPGPVHSGSGGGSYLQRLARPPNVIITPRLFGADRKYHRLIDTQDNSPSRIILPWRPPVHCFLRAQRTCHFPAFQAFSSGHHRTSQDTTGQFQDFRGLFFTRGHFDTWTRPEDLLSLLPDRVLLFLACFPLQSHQVSGGRRDRSPVVISPLTTTWIYSTYFLHQPGHLALTSTPPRAYCLLAHHGLCSDDNNPLGFSFLFLDCLKQNLTLRPRERNHRTS